MPRYSSLRRALRTEIPAGQFAIREFLLARGFGEHSISNLLRSGEMVRLARGVYTQNEPLTVPGIVRSLQRMGSDLVVGSNTALRLHGVEPAKPADLFASISLSGSDRPPKWIFKWDDRVRIQHLGTKRLFRFDRTATGGALSKRSHFVTEFGWLGVTFSMSSVERALFEVLSEVPDRVTFEGANSLMVRASEVVSQLTLRRLLERTVSLKVKRLFLWFAEGLEYECVDHLDVARHIGSGRRQLATQGRFVNKYLMTVPRDFTPSRSPT